MKSFIAVMMRSWGILKFGTFWTGDYSQFLQWLKLREETKKASSSVQCSKWPHLQLDHHPCLTSLMHADRSPENGPISENIVSRNWISVTPNWLWINKWQSSNYLGLLHFSCKKNWHWNKNNELSTVPNFTTFQNQPTLEKIPLSELF